MAIPPNMLAVAGALVQTYNASNVFGLTAAYPPTQEIERLGVTVHVRGVPYTVQEVADGTFAWRPRSGAVFREVVPIAPEVPEALAITASDPLTIELSDATYTGPLYSGVPFIAFGEGTVQIHGDQSDGAAYDFTMAFRHRFQAPERNGEFTSRRTVRARITPNNWFTLALSAFNSVSTIGPSFVNDAGATIATEALLSGLMRFTITLEIRAVQNDGGTNVARTLQEIVFDGCGFYFEQRP